MVAARRAADARDEASPLQLEQNLYEEARRHDMFSVLQIIDSMPPAAFASQGVAAWVPTIELSVSIRAIPETQWLRSKLRTRHITCGLLEADCELWDETGTLAAISRQIAQFRIQ